MLTLHKDINQEGAPLCVILVKVELSLNVKPERSVVPHPIYTEMNVCIISSPVSSPNQPVCLVYVAQFWYLTALYWAVIVKDTS